MKNEYANQYYSLAIYIPPLNIRQYFIQKRDWNSQKNTNKLMCGIVDTSYKSIQQILNSAIVVCHINHVAKQATNKKR